MTPLEVHLEARKAQHATKRAHLDLRDSERALYSLPAAIDALLNRNVHSGSFEAEISEALVAAGAETNTSNSIRIPLWALGQRDMTAAGVGGSNYLVNAAIRVGSLAELLRGRSVIATLPITSLPNCTGHVVIPRETAGPTAYALGDENTAITPSQPTIGQLALTPKNVAAVTNISRQFLQQTGEGGAAFVRAALLSAVAAKLDALAIAGSGASGEPTGVVNTAGIGSVSGTALSEAGVRQFSTSIGAALGPDCGFVTTPAVASLLAGRQTFTGASATLWSGNLYSGQLGGWPAYSAQSVPTGNLVFGAWNSLVLAEWGDSIEVAINPLESFTSGGVAMRVWATFDVGIVRPAAFALASSVT
jgi:HK97 family phage major capsid protein